MLHAPFIDSTTPHVHTSLHLESSWGPSSSVEKEAESLVAELEQELLGEVNVPKRIMKGGPVRSMP